MSGIAYSIGSVSVYYSSLVIALGAASCFCLTWALYRANGGKATVLCLFLALSTVLSVVLSRILHWDCHSEQYRSFLSAVTDYGTGDFVLSGVFIAVLLSYRIIPAKGLADKPLLLDCTAPGLLVLILLIRLSALFNSSCRGKMSVNRPALQHLPLASQIRDAAGNTEYRFATFFIEAILLAVLLVVLLSLFSKLRGAAAKNGKSGSGSVWMMFLLWYSALEIVMDSTRYDSSFARVNGFVSVVQTFCGLMMLAVLVWYSVRAVKADGLKAYQWLIWSGWLVLLGGAGVSEYLVQRHGNWYLSCYYLMSSCLVIMSWLTYRMYRHQCVKVY